MSLQVSWWVWAATIGTLALILGAELVSGIRRGPRPVSLRAAAVHGRGAVCSGGAGARPSATPAAPAASTTAWAR